MFTPRNPKPTISVWDTGAHQGTAATLSPPMALHFALAGDLLDGDIALLSDEALAEVARALPERVAAAVLNGF